MRESSISSPSGTGSSTTRKAQNQLRPGEAFNPFRMFTGVFVSEALLGMKGLSAAAKLLYGQLCRYAGEDGNAYPSYSTLGKDLGLSKRQVMRVASELKDAELITTRKRRIAGTNQQTSNVFEFIWHGEFAPKAPRLPRDPEGGDTGDLGGDEIVTLRESSEESPKEEKHTQQQLHRPSTREPSAAGDCFEFKKTLQTLRGRFPITEAHHSWANECRNSGFSDDEIDKVINCYRSVVKTFEPNAKSPWLVAVAAITDLKRRRELRRQREPEQPVATEATCECGCAEWQVVDDEAHCASCLLYRHDIGQSAVTARLYETASLHYCCDDELFEPDDLCGVGPCPECSGEFVLLFENGEQDCASCNLAALHKHNKPLAQEYERQIDEWGGLGSNLGPGETMALAESLPLKGPRAVAA